MVENNTRVSNRAGVEVFEEDEEFKDFATHDYTLSIDAQGKTIEFGISERLFKEISENFDHIDH